MQFAHFLNFPENHTSNCTSNCMSDEYVKQQVSSQKVEWSMLPWSLCSCAAPYVVLTYLIQVLYRYMDNITQAFVISL